MHNDTAAQCCAMDTLPLNYKCLSRPVGGGFEGFERTSLEAEDFFLLSPT